MTTVYVRNQRIAPEIALDSGSVVVDLLELPYHSTVTTDIDQVIQTVGYAQQEARDFALLALAIYVADKQALRKYAPDAWRRKFEVYMPVGDVAIWNAAKETLEAALEFLTGDEWRLLFRPDHNVISMVTPPFLMTHRPEIVSLFSGGLDSFIGVIDLLEDKHDLLLIGHWDTGITKQAQKRMYDTLNDRYPQKAELLSIRATPRKFTPKQAFPLPNQRQYETTTRSRSLLFIALGLLAANALGRNVPLYVPENGFISLNVPWNWNRYGSCSTRSTHPQFIYSLRAVLHKLGIANPIVNPYQFKTKGEMVSSCRNRSLVVSHASRTLSCSHPNVGRWTHLSTGNCGYCLPCVIRRASLHVIDADKASDYLFDITRNENLVKFENKGATTRSILRGLSRNGNWLPQLLANGSLNGSTGDVSKAKQLYQKGVDEIRKFLTDKASTEILAFADIYV